MFHTIGKILASIGIVICVGCASLQKGLDRLVTLEYDQSTNFNEYKLAQTLPTGGGGGSNLVKAHHGMFLVYQICSIANNESKARNFNFYLSKFYVVHNGKRYYQTPLSKDQFDTVFGPAWDEYIDEWQNAFKYEVQTAPDEKTIPPAPPNLLSISWRFVIYVDNITFVDDYKTARFHLRYDNSADESVLLVDRGYQPTYPYPPAEKSDLPLTCRP